MSRLAWFPALLLLLLIGACGGDDTPSGASGTADEAPAGVTAGGDGWSATFPGEVETDSQPVAIPGSDQPTTAETTLWESSSEALSVVTSDFPQEVMDMIDPRTLLEGTATGNGGTLATSSPVLDDDGTFRGRAAVVYTVEQGGLVTTGLAFVDGARLYQVVHVSRGGATSSWESLADSFEFTS